MPRLHSVFSKDRRNHIEEDTGPLDWQELPDGKDCRIMLLRNEVDVSDRAKWDSIFKWQKEKAELCHTTFSPRIKALIIPEEDEDLAPGDEDGEEEG